MNNMLLALLLVGVVWAADDKTFLSSINAKSTKVEGHLRCGKQPLSGAHIRLFRGNTEDLGQVIATGTTDAQGRFSVEGDSSRFSADEADIDPYLRIYHKCDEKESKKGYRRVQIRYPTDFVTLGRIPRRTYNVGALNLELTYPGEKRQKELQGL